MDRFELFSAFIEGKHVNIKGVYGIIQSIEREDGSGHRFNVTISVFTSNLPTKCVVFIDCQNK